MKHVFTTMFYMNFSFWRTPRGGGFPELRSRDKEKREKNKWQNKKNQNTNQQIKQIHAFPLLFAKISLEW